MEWMLPGSADWLFKLFQMMNVWAKRAAMCIGSRSEAFQWGSTTDPTHTCTISSWLLMIRTWSLAPSTGPSPPGTLIKKIWLSSTTSTTLRNTIQSLRSCGSSSHTCSSTAITVVRRRTSKMRRPPPYRGSGKTKSRVRLPRRRLLKKAQKLIGTPSSSDLADLI